MLECFWLFSCAPQVTNHFLDVCEGVKTDIVGVCADRSWRGFKNANRHIQIKVPMTRMKKRHTMLVSMGDVKVRLSAAAAPEPPQRANREKRYCMYGSSDKTQ